MTSRLSWAAPSAIGTSPAASAVNERLSRFQPSDCALPDRRAASTAPSSSAAESATPPGDVQDVAEDGDEDRGDLALAGDLRDGQPALRVRSGRRVAVQVELGRREVRERVQAQADLLVGHRVDERRRRGAVPTRLRDGGEDRGRECEHGRARGRERAARRSRVAAPSARTPHARIAS